MKKNELVAAIVNAGILAEAKAKHLKVVELEALLNRKSNLPIEDGFAVIAAEQAKEEAITATLPSIPVTSATPSKVETPKKVKYVKLFPDGKKICLERGLKIVRLTKDWNAFSDLVNETVGKKAPGFTVLFKTFMATQNNKEWFALVTIERKVKDSKLQNQFTCLFKGATINGKRTFLKEVEKDGKKEFEFIKLEYLKW